MKYLLLILIVFWIAYWYLAWVYDQTRTGKQDLNNKKLVIIGLISLGICIVLYLA